MWLICDNQCKLVQENPWAEPVLFNSVWWLNITPLYSTSAASGCSCTISQLPAPPHRVPLLTCAAVVSLCLDAHWLYFDPCYLLELPVTSYHDQLLCDLSNLGCNFTEFPLFPPWLCGCPFPSCSQPKSSLVHLSCPVTPVTPWKRAEGAHTLPHVILLLVDVSPPPPLIYPKSLPFQIPSFPPALGF